MGRFEIPLAAPRRGTTLAEQDRPTRGLVGPTRISLLAAVFVIGALLGYATVAVAERSNGTVPRVEWPSIGALVVIAGVLMVFAYTTYRTVHRERRLMDARRAVNFLMLARASSRVGALVAGGYLGFALQFVDQLEVELPRERVVRATIAAVTSVVIVVAALLLERACRVPKEDDD